MTKSYVFFFKYDFYIHSVAKTKVKLENVENAKTADSCSVPIERVEIGEDGKEVNITEYHKGTTICIGQCKNFFLVSHGYWKLVTTNFNCTFPVKSLSFSLNAS